MNEKTIMSTLKVVITLGQVEKEPINMGYSKASKVRGERKMPLPWKGYNKCMLENSATSKYLGVMFTEKHRGERIILIVEMLERNQMF